jgi:hypothetical protein
MRAWPGRETAPVEVSSCDLATLRATAVKLLGEGACGRIDLAAWNIELNDWVRMETLEREA